MDPLLYVGTAESWLATKPRPIFSARQNVFDVLLSFNRLSMCIFFYALHLFRLALSISLSFLTSSYIIHIHTDRQTTLSFFFLSFELCIYSNVTYYIEYYGLLLMTLVSVPLYIIRSSFIIYLFFFIERTSI